MPSDADLQAMQTMITAALQTAGRELTKFNDRAKEATGTSGGLKQMDSALLGIAKNLSGPIGIAALFVGAGKAVADFTDQRLKLSLFSRDVGFPPKLFPPTVPGRVDSSHTVVHLDLGWCGEHKPKRSRSS
jgi:hypothetical protein